MLSIGRVGYGSRKMTSTPPSKRPGRVRRKATSSGHVGPGDDVFILDVTERWYDDQHSYWAFKDAGWYAWAMGDDPAPPAFLARAGGKAVTRLPAQPTRNDKVLFVYYGAIMGHGGVYIGAESEELSAWLGDRQPLGVLTAIEDPPPEDMVDIDPQASPGPTRRGRRSFLRLRR